MAPTTRSVHRVRAIAIRTLFAKDLINRRAFWRPVTTVARSTLDARPDPIGSTTSHCFFAWRSMPGSRPALLSILLRNRCPVMPIVIRVAKNKLPKEVRAVRPPAGGWPAGLLFPRGRARRLLWPAPEDYCFQIDALESHRPPGHRTRWLETPMQPHSRDALHGKAPAA